MKKFYFFIIFILSFTLNAQIVNIPDANFKTKLLSASVNSQIASSSTPVYVNNSWSVPNYCKIDTNNDGEIQVSEALNIKWLKIQSVINLTDLTGLEAFTNLEYFLCTNNSNLDTIDVSQNLLLKVLKIGNNNFSSLDISNNINLLELESYNCNLANLNISYNPLLKRLLCYDNNISILDFNNNPNLEYIQCGSNSLTSIDVSFCPLLNTVTCYSNNLYSINIKNNNSSWLAMNFNDTPNLQYICTDEDDIIMVQQKVNSYGYTNCNVNSYCSFTPGGTYYEISGNIKFDFDNNGCDGTDINYPILKFNITDGTITGSFIANATGGYYIPVLAGNHSITPDLENPTYFNISPTNFTVNFPTQASPFTQDFCVTANGVHSDVEIVLVPTTPARPGFDARYKLIYKNNGNQVESGTISLNFDDTRLDYVVANPVYDSSVTNSFTWDYTNLQPFESREIALILNLNSPMETPAVNIGDVLNYTAIITTTNTDEMPTDNTFTLDQTAVGSYDPNDKTCLHGTTITPSEVGNYVHYVIRFENTGTYPAENIVVKDMIDLVKFDIATLVPLKSSHDFYTRINGNKVEFIFENINLDFNDATNDGYVAFKIKTLPSLVLGDTFTNNANIYFDYNFPITTNTYTTTVGALSTQDFDFGTYFTLYPNPAKEVLNIQSKQDVNINSVEIYNQLGQIVMATTNAINTIDVADLASGTYFVKVNTEKGSANAKFVKE